MQRHGRHPSREQACIITAVSRPASSQRRERARCRIRHQHHCWVGPIHNVCRSSRCVSRLQCSPCLRHGLSTAAYDPCASSSDGGWRHERALCHAQRWAADCVDQSAAQDMPAGPGLRPSLTPGWAVVRRTTHQPSRFVRPCMPTRVMSPPLVRWRWAPPPAVSIEATPTLSPSSTWSVPARKFSITVAPVDAEPTW